jgi:hypothetical protein
LHWENGAVDKLVATGGETIGAEFRRTFFGNGVPNFGEFVVGQFADFGGG